VPSLPPEGLATWNLANLIRCFEELGVIRRLYRCDLCGFSESQLMTAEVIVPPETGRKEYSRLFHKTGVTSYRHCQVTL